MGRSLDPDWTIEEAGIEDTDEILAVEIMDLTAPGPEDVVSVCICVPLFFLLSFSMWFHLFFAERADLILFSKHDVFVPLCVRVRVQGGSCGVA